LVVCYVALLHGCGYRCWLRCCCGFTLRVVVAICLRYVTRFVVYTLPLLLRCVCLLFYVVVGYVCCLLLVVVARCCLRLFGLVTFVARLRWLLLRFAHTLIYVTLRCCRLRCLYVAFVTFTFTVTLIYVVTLLLLRLRYHVARYVVRCCVTLLYVDCSRLYVVAYVVDCRSFDCPFRCCCVTLPFCCGYVPRWLRLICYVCVVVALLFGCCCLRSRYVDYVVITLLLLRLLFRALLRLL